MTIKMINVVFAAILLGSVIGCDIVKDDATPRTVTTTVYAFADKPALVSAASFSEGEDLFIGGEPTTKFGKFEKLFGGKYLLYTPNSSFKGREEVLKLTLSDNSKDRRVSNLDLVLRSADNGAPDCGGATGDNDGITGVYDYARIKPGDTLSINLLDNDIFCGVGYNGGVIGGLFDLASPTGNEAMFEIGPGRKARFQYIPPPGFVGKIKIAYYLGINWKEPGLDPSLDELLANPYEYIEAFTTAIVEVDVVAD